MKNIKILFLLLLSLFSQFLHAQKLENIKLFSTQLQDSIPVKIWLPEDYKPSNKYPVIYEFIYDHTNFIAATLQNMWSLPQAIVVYAEIQGGNEHYSTPLLTDIGQKYYLFIKNELIDYITSNYHTTHRTALGLSQGADYINYILRNDPELFSAYAIFSIERPVYYTANFKTYTSKITNKKPYFIAVANDMKERMVFANQLYDSLKTSPYINIKKEYYPNADHSYSILYGLPDALNFIFEDYYIFREFVQGEKLSDYFNNVLNEKNDRYGMLNYNSFIQHIGTLFNAQNTTSSEINSLLDLINDNENTYDIDLFNLGSLLMQAGFYDNAEKSFRLSLKKQKETEIRMETTSIYFWLSKTYENRNEYAKALKILEEGNEKTKSKKDGFLLYRIGLLKIEKSMNIKEGINNLNTLLSQVKQNMVTVFISNDKIYTEIAKGYWKLHNKKQAKESIIKALEINPANNEAKELKEIIN